MDSRSVEITAEFLEEITRSVRNILQASFPDMTPQEREDVGQDVRLKICRLAQKGTKVGNPKSYIWKIVYTAALDILDRRTKAQSLESLVERSDSALRVCLDGLSPEILGEKKALLSILKTAVEELSARRRTVVKLHLMGLDQREISAFLAWSENKVRHLLFRGLEDLGALVRAKAGGAPRTSGLKGRIPGAIKRVINHGLSEKS